MTHISLVPKHNCNCDLIGPSKMSTSEREERQREPRISNPPSKSVMIRTWRYDTMHSRQWWRILFALYHQFRFIQLYSMEFKCDSILICSLIHSETKNDTVPRTEIKKKWIEKKKAKAKPYAIANACVFSSRNSNIYQRKRNAFRTYSQKHKKQLQLTLAVK